jgi:hypothetical protein
MHDSLGVDHSQEKLPLHYVVTLFLRYLKKAVFSVSSAYFAFRGKMKINSKQKMMNGM